MTGWRLVDGSRLEDWHPGPGDAPCDVAGHDDHQRDACPLIFEGMEEDACPHGELWSDPCQECEYDAEDGRT